MTVTLQSTQTKIHLEVIDRGVGFDPHKMSQGLGLGFIGMREWLNLVDGELSTESHPGSGTTVRVSVPFVVRDEDTREGAALV